MSLDRAVLVCYIKSRMTTAPRNIELTVQRDGIQKDDPKDLVDSKTHNMDNWQKLWKAKYNLDQFIANTKHELLQT